MFMGLSIRTTNIELGIQRTPSRMNLETEYARLRLHQKHTRINISTEKPRVLIDQSKCFAETGLKSSRELSREAAQRGYRQAMKFISQTAQDGYALAAIEKGGNPTADIAVRRAYPQKQFGLDFIPKSRPEIKVTGSIDIQWDRSGEGVNSGVKGSYTPGYVRLDFEPTKIDIYVKQYPSVDIKYESNMDVSV